MKTAFSLFSIVLITAISVNSAHAQTQYNNRVVVIPLWSDGSTWKGQWADATKYNRSDIVEDGGSSYIAVVNHTSSLGSIPPSSEWQLVAASGANGAPGVKGDKGDIGDTGPAGAKGDKGDQGDTGLAGAKGDKGDQGDTGPAGAKGDKGDQGDTGLAGAKGDKGDRGDTGSAGSKGDKGDTGAVGAVGPKGDAGSVGPMGLPGAKGDKGDQGDQGEKGDKGDAGGIIVYQGSGPIAVSTGGTGTETISFNVNNMPVLPANKLPLKLRNIDLRQPFTTVNCSIALFGIFPSRSFDPFIGQISYFGFNFAPRAWAKCDGQLMAISSNTALFSLLGCTYGGDCRTTFALPDMRGRVPVHMGNGPGLLPYAWGQEGGRESVTP